MQATAASEAGCGCQPFCCLLASHPRYVVPAPKFLSFLCCCACCNIFVSTQRSTGAGQNVNPWTLDPKGSVQNPGMTGSITSCRRRSPTTTRTVPATALLPRRSLQ